MPSLRSSAFITLAVGVLGNQLGRCLQTLPTVSERQSPGDVGEVKASARAGMFCQQEDATLERRRCSRRVGL